MTTTRTLLLVLALVGAGCFGDPEYATIEPSAPPGTKSSTLGPVSLQDGLDHGAARPSGARVGAALELDDDESESGEDEVAGERLLVRVLLGDRSPAPGADVFLFEPRDGESARILYEMDQSSDPQSFLEANGQRRRAGEDGLAAFEMPLRGALVGASVGDAWHAVEIDARTAECEIVVQPNVRLAVRALDPEGVPLADVPIGLFAVRRNSVRASRRATTGADGIAEFKHPSEFFASVDEESEWRVAPALPMISPPSVTIVPAELPTEPVDIVLPRTASLVVELFESNGSPFVGSGHLTVWGEGGRGTLAFEQFVERDNKVRIPHVEPATQLSLSFLRDGSLGRYGMVASAPLLAGIESTVRFLLVPTHPVLVVHLVDQDDNALVATRVGFRVRDEEGERSRNRNARDTRDLFATTDDRGILRVDLYEGWGAGAGALVGSIRTIPVGGDVALSGVFDGPATLAPGPNDIGKVILSPPPLLVAGRVIDDMGEPVAEARIDFHQNYVDDQGALRWRRVPDLSATSDEDGAFEVVAWPPVPQMALAANERDHLRSEITPFAIGDSGVVIVLRGAGSIVGKVLVPEGMDNRGVSIGAVRGAVAPDLETLTRATVARTSPGRRGGEFELRRLEPGLYTVWCSYSGLPEVLFVAGEIEVRAGEPTRDPRLDPIDLSGALRVFNLRAVDQSGSVARVAQARWRPVGEKEWRGLGFERDGRTRIVATSGLIDVEVFAQRCSATLFEGLSNSGDLVLQPALEVAVEVDPQQLPDPAQYRFEVVLRLVGWNDASTSASLDEDGHGTFSSAGPGSYTVQFRVSKRSGGRRNTRTFSASPAQVVEVDGWRGSVVLRPKVPRAALDAALAELN